MSWFERLVGKPSKRNCPDAEDRFIEEEDLEDAQLRQAGSVDGNHYTDYVEQIKQLKREKRHEEAIAILLKLVAATENESRKAGAGWGVAPWYYEQLAVIYKKEKRYEEELSILERYEMQPKAPGAGPRKIAERLAIIRAQSHTPH